MKTSIRILMLVAAIFSCSISSSAQRADHQRMTREQLAETQARYIAKNLALDEAVSEKFISVFRQFQQEVWALGARPNRKPRNLSDAATEEALKERFEHSQKILDLRQKYYKEYSKFLTQKQIERVYQLERQMMDRLRNRSHGRHNRQK